MNNDFTNGGLFDSPEAEDPEKQTADRIMMISSHGYVAAEPPLGAPDTGGQVVYVLELSKVLGRLGYHVDIFTRRFEGQPEIDHVEERVRVVRIPCGGDDFIPKEYLYEHIPEFADNLQNWIIGNQHKYKFINSHYWDAGLAGELLSKELSIPHIHTPHSVGFWKKNNMEKDFEKSEEEFEKIYNFEDRTKYEENIFNNCSGLVATTPIQQEMLISEYELPEQKVTMIPPGYDDNKFFPMGDASQAIIKEKMGFTGNSILAISRLAHNKGLDLLVDGFSILAKRDPDAHLYLAVGHEERSETEEAIYSDLIERSEKYGISDRVHFTGYIPDDLMADCYRAADVFVLSSRYEPFGMTAVEAMACGTPTIVTAHGGLCKVIKDGIHGLKSDPFDPEDLAMDMHTILKHDGLAYLLSSEGSRIARSKFSWTEIVNQLIEFVETNDFDESRKTVLS